MKLVHIYVEKKFEKSMVESFFKEMIHHGSLLWFSESALTASSNPLLICNPKSYDGERPEIGLDCIVSPLDGESGGLAHLFRAQCSSLNI